MNSGTEKVSIIIPCFNYGHLLSETLDSLVGQTYKNWEAIIIDDGSLDNTRGVSGTYCYNDSRFKYLYQENAGLANARNTGLSYATGDFIQFLDADDLLSPEKLARQVAFLIDNPDCDICYTDVKYFHHLSPEQLWNSIRLDNDQWLPRIQRSKDLLENLVMGNIMPVNSPIIRASFLKSNNILFKEELKFLEDWDFWFQCAFKNVLLHFVDAGNAYAIVRVHSNSMSKNHSNMLCYELTIRKKLQVLFDELSDQRRKKLKGLNEKKMEKVYRDLLRERNFSFMTILREVGQNLGFWKALIVFFKECNYYRKNLI